MKFLIITFVLAVGIGSPNLQPAEKVKIEDLQKMIGGNSGKIQVINFWATWCAPCIKELPLFEQANATREDIEVSLVSIDLDLDPNPDKVYRFIDRKKLKSKVYILDERDPNTWIDKIDKSWSGAIPATLVVNLENGKRKFVEKELKEGELEEIINSVK
ncbi:MAG: TlpA disulfide reductase family protein [Cyclobacteriaceae bacterium]